MLLSPKQIIIAVQLYIVVRTIILILRTILYLIKLLGELLYKYFVTTDHLRAVFNHKYNQHTAEHVAMCFTGDCGDIKL